jgi:uncharacterized damage-inducible protein DinB
VSRADIELLAGRMEAAYRGDRFHALRANLATVQPEEWHVRPGRPSVEVFGTSPELSIADIVEHVGGAKFMYAARVSGDEGLNWTDIRRPPREIETMLEWLDEGHHALERAVAALEDDAELTAERLAPWRRPLTAEQLLSIVINHDLYHSGEINRQRALIRGAQGWDRTGLR